MMGEVLAFYGLGWQELLELDVRWFCKLHNRIPVIDARRMLSWLPVFTFPHTTESSRRSMQRSLVKQARLPKPITSPEAVDAGWGKLRNVGRPPDKRKT